jgi:hypothetical protein
MNKATKKNSHKLIMNKPYYYNIIRTKQISQIQKSLELYTKLIMFLTPKFKNRLLT